VDNPADMADNLAALAMFDRPPLQLELEVFIYEISEGDRGKLGLDWDSWKRFTTGSFEYGSGSGSAFFDKDTDTYSTLLTLDARVLADFLNYTVQSGTSKVLTSTKLTMVNSEDVAGGLSGGGRGSATATPAVVSSTVAIPYTTSEGSAGREETVGTDMAEEGVTVSILPYIGSESTTISVDVTVSSLVGYSKDTDIPLISSRKVNSLVNVKDGEPIILGGLEKTNNVTSRVGLPFLKDIPVIQYLFSKESKDTTKSKVIISIKPKLKTGDAGSDTFDME
jgi:type II secretory pathway component GspD/PulD (secretin)